MHSPPDIVQQLKHEEQQGLLHIKTIPISPSTPQEINPEGIHQVLNLLADPAVIVTTTGKLLWINNATTTIIHYNKEELVGKNFFQLHLISRKSKAILIKNLTQRVLGFNIKPYIIEIFTKEHQKLFFEINAKIITYNGQKVDLVVLRDVNDRQKAKNAAESQQKKLKAIMEHLQAGIVLIEAKTHTIIDINNYAADLIGLPKHQIIGNICHNFICPSDIGRCPITDLGETVNNSRRILVTKSGQQKPVLKTVSSLTLDNTQYIIDSFVDLSEIEKTQTELQTAKSTLKKLNYQLEEKVQERTKEVQHLLHQKDEFINQISHDLRTPLTPLLNLIPILAKKETNPKNQELFDILIRNTTYMKNMVLKATQLAQLNSSNMTLFFTEINLHQQINTIIKQLKTLTPNDQTIIHNTTPKDIQINTDQEQFNELISNLLSNAKIYNNNKGPIIIIAEQNNIETTISVIDAGIGMTQEQIKNVFDEFYKADWSRHNFNTSGLGLSICKRIIELHGGKISIYSAGLNKGTTIQFTIPRYKNTIK